MAIFNFTLPIYGFDQWSGSASTNNTVGYPDGTTFTLNTNAALTILDVQDDDGNADANSPDNRLDDGFIDTPGDGSSPSTGNNDQVLTEAVTVNGQSFGVGSQVELEFAFTTTSGDTFWIIRIAGQNVGIGGATLPTPGTEYVVSGSSDGAFSPVGDIPCFLDGTLIETPNGEVPIESLQAGDLVTTRDGSPKAIRWAGSRRVTPLELMFFPELTPITIMANAVDGVAPTKPLSLSRNHRIMVHGSRLEFYFGVTEVLVSVKYLLNGRSVKYTKMARPFWYRHLLFEDHEILIANGLPAESLYPAFDNVSFENQLDQDLHGHRRESPVPFARPILRKHEASVLLTT